MGVLSKFKTERPSLAIPKTKAEESTCAELLGSSKGSERVRSKIDKSESTRAKDLMEAEDPRDAEAGVDTVDSARRKLCSRTGKPGPVVSKTNKTKPVLEIPHTNKTLPKCPRERRDIELPRAPKPNMKRGKPM